MSVSPIASILLCELKSNERGNCLFHSLVCWRCDDRYWFLGFCRMGSSEEPNALESVNCCFADWSNLYLVASISANDDVLHGASNVGLPQNWPVQGGRGCRPLTKSHRQNKEMHASCGSGVF